MKNSNVVSTSVLLFNGLLFLILGARMWSAPDVFADGLGLMPATQTMIDALATVHGASFIALGLAAAASAKLTVLLRWFSLLLLTTLGVAAYAWLWSFGAAAGNGYERLLSGALAVNIVTLITAFLGEPLFGNKANLESPHWG